MESDSLTFVGNHCNAFVFTPVSSSSSLCLTKFLSNKTHESHSHVRSKAILSMVAANPSSATTTNQEATTKLSKVEEMKVASKGLRYPLLEEMQNDEVFISENGVQIMKYHGSYQQDDRERRAPGKPKHYQFMLRLKMPAGEFPAHMYRTLDDLSEEYGNHTLRATTRCAWQMHGILKGNMKMVMSTLMNSGGGTMGACGDISRNVVATPAPIVSKEYEYVRYYSKMIAEVLAPQTGAFAEMWLDGEKAASIESWKKSIDMNEVQRIIKHDNGKGVVFNDKEEPIYGETYLPRKFKVGITVPGDNSIDIYTQDIGLVVITKKNGELDGFNVIVGGGMGRTHNKENTFARTGDHLGFVPKTKVFALVKAIVAAQRDHGNREYRPNARMKYLVDKLGIAEFKKLVESYFDGSIRPMKRMPQWKYEDWLGWHEQGDGNWFLGLFVENGRIKNDGDFKLKTALRALVDRYNLDMIVSPNQNVILRDIPAKNKLEVELVLTHYGVKLADQYSRNRVTAMACPAFPLCGLAITEAERHMPNLVDRVDALLAKMKLADTEIIMRMTGCPNGCTRPYMAEIGFVGSGPMMYQLWLGGSPGSTRLAFDYMQKVKDADMEATLEPLFSYYRSSKKRNESFGDFCARIGKDGLKEYADHYVPGSSHKKALKPRVLIQPSKMEELRKRASERGISIAQVLDELLEAAM
mmetsp:Transcript_40492/g.41313  ORF Transcript_40492/g.41313 Transcript_40492/m.41313 type:complete len:696 (-) Transcript_40492:70-2157(-)